MADRLVISGLTIQADRDTLVDQVSLEVHAGHLLALVGASGSGKSLTARACLGLRGPNPGVVSGEVLVTDGGTEHRPYAQPAGPKREAAFGAIRGRLVGYMPQDARASLNPLWTVGRQLKAVIRQRKGEGTLPSGGDDPAAWLQHAGFEDPHRVRGLYAHELSGGMAQRACIALALARGSRFLIADEPTTGLDPTVQRGILKRIRELREAGIGLILITHDLRLVPDLADEVAVMHAGRIVDRLPADQLAEGRSPHTRHLLEATSRIAGGRL